jgi:hypothetical protein
VPSGEPNLRRLCQTYFNTELLIVGEPDCKLGIKVLIDGRRMPAPTGWSA